MKIKFIISRITNKKNTREINMTIEIVNSPTSHTRGWKRRERDEAQPKMKNSISFVTPVVPEVNVCPPSAEATTHQLVPSPSLQPQLIIQEEEEEESNHEKQFLEQDCQTPSQVPCHRCGNEDPNGIVTITVDKPSECNLKTENDSSLRAMTSRPNSLTAEQLEINMQCDEKNSIIISRYPLSSIKNADSDIKIRSLDADIDSLNLAMPSPLQQRPMIMITHQHGTKDGEQLWARNDHASGFFVCARCGQKDLVGPPTFTSTAAHDVTAHHLKTHSTRTSHSCDRTVPAAKLSTFAARKQYIPTFPPAPFRRQCSHSIQSKCPFQRSHSETPKVVHPPWR